MAEGFKMWAIVELFGHSQIAGYVTEQEIAGTSFLRVDVPGKGDEGFTKLYGPSAIYCMTPVSEEVALAVVERLRVEPIGCWTPQVRRELPSPVVDDDEF